VKVVVTGARGMVGASFLDSWSRIRPNDEVFAVTRDVVDLIDGAAVRELVASHKPDLIVHSAAHVDGIANKLAHPTEYLLDNVLIDTSVIGAAIDARVPSLMYISSAVIYPEDAPQPLGEALLLSGRLEEVNEGYALAKVVGTKLCEYASKEHGFAYRALVLPNLYGPGDTFDAETGHLIAAILSKVHAAKANSEDSVVIWGDGQSRREFTFTPDATDWLAQNAGAMGDWPVIMNLGPGMDHTIDEYYETAREIIGFTGDFDHDTTKPSGTRRRLLDSSIAGKFGWKPPTSIVSGMTQTYESMIAVRGE
jgi:GDP-L-fucose synthase